MNDRIRRRDRGQKQEAVTSELAVLLGSVFGPTSLPRGLTTRVVERVAFALARRDLRPCGRAVPATTMEASQRDWPIWKKEEIR
jgi:hypothetical protein